MKSPVDERAVLLRIGERFIVVVIVVHDLTFGSNDHVLLEEFKTKLSGTLDVKLFGEIESVIGWNVIQDVDKITTVQK